MLNSLSELLSYARSLLFVPGDRPERFVKAAVSGADAIVIDLEDAVATTAKDEARKAADRWLASGRDAVIRVNGTGTDWHGEDVAMAARHRCAVMIPKAHSAAHIAEVRTRLPGATPVVALIETAAGIAAAAEICAVDGVVRAAFGSIDLAAELGIDPDDDESMRYARSSLVVAAAAAARPAPLDGVTTVVDDDGPVTADAARAARLGFGGKLCIHPRQAAIVNACFSPSADDLTWARRVRAAAEGGVCAVDGRMVDKPVLERAAKILARERLLDRANMSENAR